MCIEIFDNFLLANMKDRCDDIMHACHAKTSCYVYFCVNACVLAKEVVLEKKCFSLKMACLFLIFLSSFNR